MKRSPAELSPADQHRLRAAEGWLGLGDPASARAELDDMDLDSQGHPAVLRVRWWLASVVRDWQEAAEAAARLTVLCPDDGLAWLHYSFALHELKRTVEARDELLAVADRFPKDGTMRYNLACYECCLGNLERARAWLRVAFRMDANGDLRRAAREDPDLTALWNELPGLESGPS